MHFLSLTLENSLSMDKLENVDLVLNEKHLNVNSTYMRDLPHIPHVMDPRYSVLCIP